jgi:hypothetical protein
VRTGNRIGYALNSLFFLCALCVLCGGFLHAQPGKQLDPAAWGGDHVDKPVPEYVTGDECLFCHRADIGPTWANNRHHLTLREPDPGSSAMVALEKSPTLNSLHGQVRLILGGKNRQRFLKQSKVYGKLDLLSVEWIPAGAKDAGKLVATENPHWEGHTFADSCAGCHTTGVDSRARTFSAVGLDCYACHGSVDLNHSKDTSLVYLSKKRKDPARVVTSVCAQCHVRTGKSASTGLPYPNNFVAGDNLFRDLRVDLSPDAIVRLNPGDRHVLENVRDVVLLGKEEVTCLSCHSVHKESTKKHHVLAQSDSCLACHNATASKKNREPYEVHSQTCRY